MMDSLHEFNVSLEKLLYKMDAFLLYKQTDKNWKQLSIL